MTLIIIGIIAGVFVISTVGIYLIYFVPLRSKESGFKYVYVELDGTVRELDDEEKKYLRNKFEPSDGNRPYLKNRYKSQTIDGKIWGYIRRRRVPKSVEIKEYVAQQRI